MRNIILFGSGSEKIPFVYLSGAGKTVSKQHTFEGIVPNFERRYKETDSAHIREELAKYLNARVCPDLPGHAAAHRCAPRAGGPARQATSRSGRSPAGRSGRRGPGSKRCS